ncbi:MAG: 50S ribosomal protein L2 [Candidatus Aenigmatarchaeota archaeon]|nr:MAG: 50S ribosomal protein L2 [Candidatus Aenigmarchaeota archaeon]
MGKVIRAQKKGKSPKYWAPSHRHPGLPKYIEGTLVVKDIIHGVARNTPLLRVQGANASALMIASEGVATGDTVSVGAGETKPGNVLPLAQIPEGVPIFNIEAQPGDNGAYARSGGSFAFIVSKSAGVVVRLPSKKTRTFNPSCRATIGTPAGAGRKDKPFVSAGARFHYMKARGKAYPVVSGDKMNAVDHPFGGRTKKGIPKTVSRNAPPGAKVGSIAASRTGRRKK